jgi:hypothetical protein
MISESGSVKLIGFVVDAVLRHGSQQQLVTGGDPVGAEESDVLNLAALLYAALVGRWPGTEGTAVPAAPAEHGRPLRPRQVRAGVPRPLDAICEQVLNAGAHPQMVPIRTAHEIFAALSDFIGDPGAAVPVGVPHGSTSTTARTDPTDQPTDEPADDPVTEPEVAAATPEDTDDLPDTDPEVDSAPAIDPEATQAAPMFFDPDSGVGWLSGEASRGVRSDGSDPATGQRPERPADARPRTPPAPLPDPPQRPLFADEPTVVVGQDAPEPVAGPVTSEPRPRQRDEGPRRAPAGTDSVPAAWGPDVDPPTPGGGTRWAGTPSRPPGRGWFRLAVLVAAAVLVVVAAVVALNLGRGSGGGAATPRGGGSTSPSASASRAAAVRIAGVQDFDPEGDPPEENPDLAPLAVDGKPRTAWETVTYRGNPRLGGLKKGVGLRVDLGRVVAVRDVRVTLLGRPTSLDVLAAPPAAGTAPTTTDGLVTLGSVDGAGATADVKPDKAVRTRWVVVWLTSLPPASGGFQGRVAEISVRS